MKRWLASALCLALLFSGCAAASSDTDEGYTVYYLAGSASARGSDAIQARDEQLELAEDAGVEETAAAVVERLLLGSSDGMLASPIPSSVELLSLSVENRMAYVDFSSGYTQLNGVDLTLADYCLTLSLTALEGVSAVTILSQGRPLGQQPKAVFYERDVLLSTMDDVLRTVEVTLYFLNSDGVLSGEKRQLEIYEGQTLAENLVAALLAGPEDRTLTAAIPQGFAIHSVRVENGICYVNLPSDALDLLPEDEDQQRMILWSLSDSLYSMEKVEGLRFLVDGQELLRFGSVPVDSVLTRPQG